MYDIGKSEYSNGMTVVGKVIELEFDDYDKNKAVIESMQNEYEITDDNEFEFWTKSIEDKTESLSATEKTMNLVRQIICKAVHHSLA